MRDRITLQGGICHDAFGCYLLEVNTSNYGTVSHCTWHFLVFRMLTLKG